MALRQAPKPERGDQLGNHRALSGAATSVPFLDQCPQNVLKMRACSASRAAAPPPGPSCGGASSRRLALAEGDAPKDAPAAVHGDPASTDLTVLAPVRNRVVARRALENVDAERVRCSRSAVGDGVFTHDAGVVEPAASVPIRHRQHDVQPVRRRTALVLPGRVAHFLRCEEVLGGAAPVTDHLRHRLDARQKPRRALAVVPAPGAPVKVRLRRQIVLERDIRVAPSAQLSSRLRDDVGEGRCRSPPQSDRSPLRRRPRRCHC